MALLGDASLPEISYNRILQEAAALQTHPPLLGPTDHGWSHTEGSTRITPTIVPLATPLAPDDLLKVIKCGCYSNTPCPTKRCGCKSHAIPCTLFCVCKGGDACRNQKV